MWWLFLSLMLFFLSRKSRGQCCSPLLSCLVVVFFSFRLLWHMLSPYLKSCGKGYLICLVLWLCCSLCFVANTIPLFKVLWWVLFDLLSLVVMPFSVLCGKRYLFPYLKSCGKWYSVWLVVWLCCILCAVSFWKSCGKCHSHFSCLAVISFLCHVIISFCKSCSCGYFLL